MGRGGRGGRNRKRLFDTWCFVENGSLGFCEIVICRKQMPNVHLVVIRANTTKEGDTVLWAQFLNQTPSVQMIFHGRRKTDLGKAPVLQPLMLTQHFCIRPLRGVLLKALSEEVIEEG